MIMPSDTANYFRLQQRYMKEFQKHAAKIAEYQRFSWGDEGPGDELREALNFFHLKIVTESMDFDFQGNHWDVVLVPDNVLKNPADREDFFDLLRELDRTLSLLSREIRSINDPEKISPNIKAVRAYLDAFREFLDIERGQAPDTIPAELPKGLRERIHKVDWGSISDRAQKWADTIVKIIRILFQ